MDKIFQEQLKKHKVLNELSRIEDIAVIKNWQGDVEIPIKQVDCHYCRLVVFVSEIQSDILVEINGRVLLEIKNDGEYSLPIFINVSDIIFITGTCGKLILKLTGAKLDNLLNNIIMPRNKRILSRRGNYIAYSYEGADDVMRGELQIVESLNGVLFEQSFVQGGDIGVGRIFKNDNVSFCTSFDNYATAIQLIDNCDSAIFLQNYESQVVNFVYIKGGVVYCTDLNSLGQLGERYTLLLSGNKIPKTICSSQTYGNSSKIYAVITHDNTIIVYYAMYNANHVKIAEFTGKNVKIIERNNIVTIIVFVNYSVNIYNFNLYENGANVGLSIVSSKCLDNIIDCVDVDGQLLLTSVGGYEFYDE